MNYPITPIKAGPLGPQIDMAYQQSGPFSWVREAYVNAAQAGATTIDFTVEWEAVQVLGVYRRLFVDTGHGMGPKNLTGYINTLGGSGRILGLNENHGYGAKVSLLPWNLNGVVVISRVGDDTSLIWMTGRKGENGGEDSEYGARQFNLNEGMVDENQEPLSAEYSSVVNLSEFPDGFIIDGLDWCKVAEGALGSAKDRLTGTAFVLLGTDEHPDTVLGDPRFPGERSKYGIQQFLNNRFFELPTPTTPFTPGVTSTKPVARLITWANWSNRDKWPTEPNAVIDGVKARDVHMAQGLEYTLDNSGTTAAPLKGTSFIPRSASNPLAVKVHWWLREPISTAEKVQGTSRGDVTGYPVTALLHEVHKGIPEVFDLEAMGVAGQGKYKGQGAVVTRRIKNFVKIEEIASRVALVFEPVPDGDQAQSLYPAGNTRTHLQFSSPEMGAREMPWTAWQYNFVMPDPIREAIEKYFSEKDPDPGLSDRARKRLIATYASWLERDVNRVRSENGTEFGEPTQKSASKPRGKAAGKEPSPDPEPKPTGPDKIRDPKREDFNPSDAPTAVRHRKVKTPKQPLIEVEFDAVPEQDSWHAVQYIEGETKRAVVNTLSSSYIRTVAFILNKYIATGRLTTTDPDDFKTKHAIKLIHKGIQKHVSLAVTDLMTEAHKHPEDAALLVSDLTVSATLKGIAAIEFLVADDFKAELPVIKVAAEPETETTEESAA